MTPALRNVVVVGGSYVGLNLIRELIGIVPASHRILLVEPHSHFNHIFTFPRFAILPGHEQKAFVPYTGYFTPTSRHRAVTARATHIYPDHIQIDKSWNGSDKLPFEYLVVATGTRLAAPSMMPFDDDVSSVQYLQGYQSQLATSQRVAIIGGGAVGVQMALDLKELYPEKGVTVVHSREKLMHQFHSNFHDMLNGAFDEKGIKLITQTRAKVPSGGFRNDGQLVNVDLTSGGSIQADFVILATGQKPNNELIKSLPTANPNSLINETNGFIRIKPTLQIQDDEYPHIFAIGDIADTGLHKAARPAGSQAAAVAKNIISLIEGRKADAEYEKSPRAIHLSMGLKRNVIFRNPVEGSTEPWVNEKFDGREDMGVDGMWGRLNVPLDKPVAVQEVRAEL